MEGLRQPLLRSGRGELRNFSGFGLVHTNERRGLAPPARQQNRPPRRKNEGECKLDLAAGARPPFALPQTRVTEVGQVGSNGYDHCLDGKKVSLVFLGKSHKIRHGCRHSG
jgi:hypothetical protein